MSRRNQWLGYFFVILSAVIFGCMPLGANFLYAQGVTPMSLVFLRNLLSLPLLALLGSRQGGLRISRDAMYRLAKDPDDPFPIRYIGGKTRDGIVLHDELVAWVERNSVVGSPRRD